MILYGLTLVLFWRMTCSCFLLNTCQVIFHHWGFVCDSISIAFWGKKIKWMIMAAKCATQQSQTADSRNLESVCVYSTASGGSVLLRLCVSLKEKKNVCVRVCAFDRE